MILFPAIDIRNGQCVRLLRGDMTAATVFGPDPSAQARSFVAAGCEWLHIVDLDGAFAGAPVNVAAVEAILAAVDVPVQLGGGIRDIDTITRWLDKGVARVILGTAAVEDTTFLAAAAKTHPGKIVVGIDARGGRAATRGWADQTEISAVDLARRAQDCGAAAIVHTDIDRDGAMQGPNVAATAALSRAVAIPVIASGGVSSMDDVLALRDCGAPLEGIVAGRALYEGAIGLTAVLSALRD